MPGFFVPASRAKPRIGEVCGNHVGSPLEYSFRPSARSGIAFVTAKEIALGAGEFAWFIA